MKYNVLVTGTSSYGIGEGILKTLLYSSYIDLINIFSASNSILTAYKKYCKNYYLLPNANSLEYYEEIKKIIKSEKINILIPGSEAEILFFSKRKHIIEKELKIDIWVNEYEVLEIFENKLNAEHFFQDFGIKTPESYSECKNKFPLIIKPIHGKSSEGIYIVNNLEQYTVVCDYYKVIKKNIIVQDFIEKDAEYTVSFINLDNRIETLIMERILNKGATQYAKIIEEPKIIDILKKLDKALEKESILNLQILKKNDEFYVFEINPRFSGSAPMRAKLGYNEFDIMFAHKYLNKIHEYTLKKNSYCIRGYDEFIYKNI